MSELNQPDDDLGFDLNLDSLRSARREAAPRTPGLRISGERIPLPPELPLDVLEPLTRIDMDISVLIRQVLDARRAGGEQANETMLGAIIDMIVVNPQLPQDLIEAVKEMGRRLLGPAGYELLVGFRPTIADIGVIARYVMTQYGVGLGEASPSSDSSEGTGTTSKPTSKRTTTSTSGGPGRRRAAKAS